MRLVWWNRLLNFYVQYKNIGFTFRIVVVYIHSERVTEIAEKNI